MTTNMQDPPGRLNRAYSGVPTFLRSDYCDDIDAMEADYARNAGGRIVTMPELRRDGADAVVDHLPEGADVYVTIDIDAYDMSLCPGCVSAEPGGLTFEEMQAALGAIARRLSVVGYNFVEVNPPLEVGTGVTSYLGALTVAMFLGYIDDARRGGASGSTRGVQARRLGGRSERVHQSLE